MKDYSDIINLPNHKSTKHKHMSLRDRAAQFAPFAALTGYEDSIIEEGRRTTKKPELTEDAKTILNEKIQYLNNFKSVEAEFIYFQKDTRKQGGMILSKFGVIKKLDQIERNIILTNNDKISFDNLIDIKSQIFNNFEY